MEMFSHGDDLSGATAWAHLTQWAGESGDSIPHTKPHTQHQIFSDSINNLVTSIPDPMNPLNIPKHDIDLISGGQFNEIVSTVSPYK